MQTQKNKAWPFFSFFFLQRSILKSVWLALAVTKAFNLLFWVRTKEQPIFSCTPLSVAIKRKLEGGGQTGANDSVLAHHVVLNFFWSRFEFGFWHVNHAVARVHLFCTRVAVEGVGIGIAEHGRHIHISLLSGYPALPEGIIAGGVRGGEVCSQSWR